MDLKAFVTEIELATGATKVNYVGYDLGNMQMFYTLGRDAEGWWPSHIHKFVALAPCAFRWVPPAGMTQTEVTDDAGNTVMDPLTGAPKMTTTFEMYTEETWREGPLQLPQVGVTNFFGPGWENGDEKPLIE